jgi:hypothetical protein
MDRCDMTTRKPHIFLDPRGLIWVCRSNPRNSVGFGLAPEEAWEDWAKWNSDSRYARVHRIDSQLAD